MSRFGDEYNPYGIDKGRFECQGDFEDRREADKTAREDGQRRETEHWREIREQEANDR